MSTPCTCTGRPQKGSEYKETCVTALADCQAKCAETAGCQGIDFGTSELCTGFGRAFCAVYSSATRTVAGVTTEEGQANSKCFVPSRERAAPLGVHAHACMSHTPALPCCGSPCALHVPGAQPSRPCEYKMQACVADTDLLPSPAHTSYLLCVCVRARVRVCVLSTYQLQQRPPWPRKQRPPRPRKPRRTLHRHSSATLGAARNKALRRTATSTRWVASVAPQACMRRA